MSNTLHEMTKDMQVRIRELAYLMWESAGRQHGMAMEYWLQAEQEVVSTLQAAAERMMPGNASSPEPEPEPAKKKPAKAAPQAAAPEPALTAPAPTPASTPASSPAPAPAEPKATAPAEPKATAKASAPAATQKPAPRRPAGRTKKA
ncbi:MAG: DUF2934 domain-containing protein [Defluviicoccus sp.]|nr:MAG: DUF2934 domain-containing protein [Defluviicoccus sp.]